MSFHDSYLEVREIKYRKFLSKNILCAHLLTMNSKGAEHLLRSLYKVRPYF